MKKYHILYRKIGALILAGILCLCGCTTQEPEDDGQEVLQDNRARGRYMESVVELPERYGIFFSLSLGEDSIRIGNTWMQDIVSRDGGQNFRLEGIDTMEGIPDGLEVADCVAVSPTGEKLVSIQDKDEEGRVLFRYFYKSAEGEVTELPLHLNNEDNYFRHLWCGEDGEFYGTSYGNAEKLGVYRIHISEQTEEWLFDTENTVFYLNVCGDYLYAGTKDKLYMYRISDGELVETDEVLQKSLQNQQDISSRYTMPYLICSGTEENQIYVVTKAGLYQHALYGSTMEQVIDGALCSIGDRAVDGIKYVDMLMLAGEGAPEFLILYDNGGLYRYTYDSTVLSIPEQNITVFSLYRSNTIDTAVSSFQKKYPDISVRYEVGMTGENGMTEEDVLKNLSMELAAGKGPDVIIMDGLPYDSYAEKGILKDLSEMQSNLNGQEALFDSLVDQLKREGKTYSIPATFSYAILSGDAEELNGLHTLKDLADAAETIRNQKPTGTIFYFETAESALKYLSLGSYGAWMKEDGTLNREELMEFLIQAKRIYEVQMAGITQEPEEEQVNYNRDFGDGIIKRQTSTPPSALTEILKLQDGYDFAIGMGETELLSYTIFKACIREGENQDFILMPGAVEHGCGADNLLAVNAASKVQEAAEKFVLYTLSYDFQSTNILGGIPMNRTAFEVQFRNDLPGNPKAVGAISLGELSITAQKLSEEEVENFISFIESMDTVQVCPPMVYQAVIDIGQKALRSECSIEEAVNEIEQKVQIYLAE